MALVAEIEREAALGHAEARGPGEAERPRGESDAALVAAVLTGTPQVFAALVRRYTEMIATFAYVRTRDRDLAEEIAQETMVRAYEKLWSLRVPRHFSNWLLGIAGNVTMQTMEKRSRAALDIEEMDLGSPSASPGDEAESRELWSRILRHIDQLDPRYKVPFVMKHQEGLSCDDIAERLGVPEGTVRGRLSRAYGLHRRKLAAPGS